MYNPVGYIQKVSQNFHIWKFFRNISWNSVFFARFSINFAQKKSIEKSIFSCNFEFYRLKIGTPKLHNSLHLFTKGFLEKVIFGWNMADFRPKIAKNPKFHPKRRFRSFITLQIFREFLNFFFIRKKHHFRNSQQKLGPSGPILKFYREKNTKRIFNTPPRSGRVKLRLFEHQIGLVYYYKNTVNPWIQARASI